MWICCGIYLLIIAYLCFVLLWRLSSADKSDEQQMLLSMALFLRIAVTQGLGALLLELKSSKTYQEERLTWRSSEGRMKNAVVFIPLLVIGFDLPRRLAKGAWTMAEISWNLAYDLYACAVQLLLVWCTVPFYVFLHVASAEVEQVKKVIRDIQEGESASQVRVLQQDYLALCQSLREKCLQLDHLSALILLDVFFSGCVTLASPLVTVASNRWWAVAARNAAENSFDLVFNPIPPLLLYALLISWRCDSLAGDAQRLASKLSVERRESFIGNPEHVNELLNFIQLVRAMPTGWFAFGTRVDSSLVVKAIGPTVLAILKSLWGYIKSPHAGRVLPPLCGIGVVCAIVLVSCLIWKSKTVKEGRADEQEASRSREPSSEHLGAVG